MKLLRFKKEFIFIYFVLLIFFLVSFISLPNQYITKTIIKPITKIDFDNRVFELSFKHKNLGLKKEYLKKVFEDEKKTIIKIENVDSLNNNSVSPLSLFYKFFRITEDLNYKQSKFQINFFENSFEYFFIISIKSKNLKENEKELLSFLNSSNRTLNMDFNKYLLNAKIEKEFDINRFNFVDVKLDNFKSKSTKIDLKKFLILNFFLSLFVAIFIIGIKIKYFKK